MRLGLGFVGLLVVLAIVATVVKKQLASSQQALPAAVQPHDSTTKPAATVHEQSQQIQQQVQQQVQTLMQPRPMPDDGQ